MSIQVAAAAPPSRTNLILTGLILAAFLASMLVMPVVMGGHAVGMVLIALCLVPLNTPLWSLIHEAIHKNFHSDKRLNEMAGRVMSVVFGAAFGVLRFGHLMHHQYNRDWESEYYTPRKPGDKIAAWVKHYFTMLGGLYLTEIAMSFMIAAVPASVAAKIARRIFSDERHYEAVLNSVLKPENVTKIRIDCAAIVLLYTGVFWLFGAAWIVPLVALAGRGAIISLMDNSYHYGTPADGSVVAKELKTSKFYSKFILNFNYHATHHNNVKLPWAELAAQHAREGAPYAQGLGEALLAQFKGPIEIETAE